MKLHQHVTTEDLRKLSFITNQITKALAQAQDDPISPRVKIQKGPRGKITALRDLSLELDIAADILENEHEHEVTYGKDHKGRSGGTSATDRP